MSEVEQAARDAWAAMVVTETPFTRSALRPGPMPPDIALDMVQDVTGDRDDAVTAMLQAASDWVLVETVGRLLRGIDTTTEVDRSNSEDAKIFAMHLREESTGFAATFLTHIIDRSRPAFAVSLAEARACEWWKAWDRKASLALQLCRQLIEVAHPA